MNEIESIILVTAQQAFILCLCPQQEQQQQQRTYRSNHIKATDWKTFGVVMTVGSIKGHIAIVVNVHLIILRPKKIKNKGEQFQVGQVVIVMLLVVHDIVVVVSVGGMMMVVKIAKAHELPTAVAVLGAIVGRPRGRQVVTRIGKGDARKGRIIIG